MTSIIGLKLSRIPLMMLVMLALLAGITAGLQRIGWTLPVTSLASHHGAIMVGGFLGTLISLEKIIPLKVRSLFLLPVISGVSIILFAAGLPLAATISLIVASVGLSIVFITYWLRVHKQIYTIMLAGSLCWLTGNVILLISGFYPASLPWWTAFALFVIIAERIELMEFLPVTAGQKKQMAVLLVLYMIGCALSFHGPGNYIAAASLTGIALWLMRHDVVSLNLKKQHLHRYVAIALLSGYFSLLLSALFIILADSAPLGYDVFVHGIFIGFVFSMIFAHGPIVLPGVLGIIVKPPYHPLLYVWLIALHLSWLSRAAADLMLDIQLRKYSGLLSTIAILGYFTSLVIVAIRANRAKPQ